MKLVVATPLYPPEPGGPATYAKLLEDELPKRGISLTLVKFSSVRSYPPGIRHFIYFCLVLVSGLSARAILVQDTVSCGVPAALAALVLRKPLIVRVPGDYAWEQSRQRHGVLDSIDTFQTRRYASAVERLRALQQFVVRRAARVIVPSQYFKGIVALWGVPKEKIEVIYHGIGPVSPRAPVSRPKGTCIVSSGRLVPWKGFSTLITLLTQLKTWSLVIVGDGPDRSRLEMLARTHGVYERVLFTGALSREETLGFVQAADVFVLNSSFESFSFQVAEAMMLGVPIIAASSGSIPELITEGVEGRLITADNLDALRVAIESVVREPAVWNARKEAAKKRAALFSIDAMMEKTVQLLHSL